jgi:hypothetical protein
VDEHPDPGVAVRLARGEPLGGNDVSGLCADAVARRVAIIGESLIARGSAYRFERPELKRQPEKWFEPRPNMEGRMEFVKLEEGIYRPVSMPPRA